MTLATTILLALPWSPASADDVDERALLLWEACSEPGPREVPAGDDCIAEVAVLWWLEARLQLFVAANGHGCGPMQVIPMRLRNTRIGTVWTPPCGELASVRVGLKWGLYLLRTKARFGSWRARARAYNGHPLHRERYSRRAVELRRRVEAALGGEV